MNYAIEATSPPSIRLSREVRTGTCKIMVAVAVVTVVMAEVLVDEEDLAMAAVAPIFSTTSTTSCAPRRATPSYVAGRGSKRTTMAHLSTNTVVHHWQPCPMGSIGTGTWIPVLPTISQES